MTSRTDQKEQTRQHILECAADLFRTQGVTGTSLTDIMTEAGLTHGGFYAHFKNKEDLLAHSYTAAMDSSREEWFEDIIEHEPEEALRLLINRYLSRDHRDNPDEGCPMPALLGELEKEGLCATEAEQALRTSIHLAKPSVAQARHLSPEAADAETVATFATMVGGMLLARSVADEDYSDYILKSCRAFLKKEIS